MIGIGWRPPNCVAYSRQPEDRYGYSASGAGQSWWMSQSTTGPVYMDTTLPALPGARSTEVNGNRAAGVATSSSPRRSALTRVTTSVSRPEDHQLGSQQVPVDPT